MTYVSHSDTWCRFKTWDAAALRVARRKENPRRWTSPMTTIARRDGIEALTTCMSDDPTRYRHVQHLFSPPPDDPFWYRVRDFLKRHLSTIISHPVCAFFFAGALGCILGVWFSNGDWFVTVPVLTLGWIFAALGWWWAPTLSPRAKLIWILICAFPLAIEASVLRWHIAPGNIPALDAGANIRFVPVPPTKLNDGLFAFPIEIRSSGEQPVLNYSYGPSGGYLECASHNFLKNPE